MCKAVALFVMILCLPESEPYSFQIVEEGEDIILSCENVRPEQNNCDDKSWTFVFWLPNVKANEEMLDVPRMSSQRRLTETCALEIQNVNYLDAGIFSCVQNDPFILSLAVVSVNMQTYNYREDRNAIQYFSCQGLASSEVKIRLLLNGKALMDPEIMTTHYYNAITVEIPQSHLLYDNTDLLSCEVTHGPVMKEFSFRSNRTETHRLATPQNSTDGALSGDTSPTAKGWLWTVLAAAAGRFTAVALVT